MTFNNVTINKSTMKKGNPHNQRIGAHNAYENDEWKICKKGFDGDNYGKANRVSYSYVLLRTYD